jgi:hypothetical protein
LKRALSSQGFTDPNKCETDSSITRIIFRQRGGGLFGPYPAFAVVAWKTDAQGRVVWTKSMIAFTGP